MMSLSWNALHCDQAGCPGVGFTDASTDSDPGYAPCESVLILAAGMTLAVLGVQLAHRSKSRVIVDHAVALFVGMLLGGVLFYGSWPTLHAPLKRTSIAMDNMVFFNILIPPVTFYAGFSFKKKMFFRNFVTICSLGLLGSILLAVFFMASLVPVLQRVGLTGFSPAYDQTSALNYALDYNLTRTGLVNERVLFSSTADRTVWPSLHTNTHSIQQQPPLPFASASNATFANESDLSIKKRAQGGLMRGLELLLGEERAGADSVLRSALILGAIFSSTDALTVVQILSPAVQPVLHSLLFGEGVLNTPTSVVLVQAVDSIRGGDVAAFASGAVAFCRLFVGSLIAGAICGMISALLTKYLFVKGHSADRELVLITGFMILAYCIAETNSLSGAFTTFFCGVTMSHYTWHSVSPDARVIAIIKFRVLADSAELFMFVYAGLDVSWTLLSHTDYSKSELLRQACWLAAVLLMLILVGRALLVGTAVLLVNVWRTNSITLREGCIMWWGGLARSSITMALVYTYFYSAENRSFEAEVVLVACIIVLALLTIAVSSVSPIILGLLEHQPHQSRLTMLSSLNDDFASVQSAAALPSMLHRTWRRFDKKVMQPVFGGRDIRMPHHFNSVADLSQSMFENHSTAHLESRVFVPGRVPMIQDASLFPAYSPLSSSPSITSDTTLEPDDDTYGLISGSLAIHFNSILETSWDGILSADDRRRPIDANKTPPVANQPAQTTGFAIKSKRATDGKQSVNAVASSFMAAFNHAPVRAGYFNPGGSGKSSSDDTVTRGFSPRCCDPTARMTSRSTLDSVLVRSQSLLSSSGSLVLGPAPSMMSRSNPSNRAEPSSPPRRCNSALAGTPMKTQHDSPFHLSTVPRDSARITLIDMAPSSSAAQTNPCAGHSHVPEASNSAVLQVGTTQPPQSNTLVQAPATTAIAPQTKLRAPPFWRRGSWLIQPAGDKSHTLGVVALPAALSHLHAPLMQTFIPRRNQLYDDPSLSAFSPTFSCSPVENLDIPYQPAESVAESAFGDEGGATFHDSAGKHWSLLDSAESDMHWEEPENAFVMGARTVMGAKTVLGAKTEVLVSNGL